MIQPPYFLSSIMNCLRIALFTLFTATVMVVAAPQEAALKQAETWYLQGLQAQKDNDRKAAREALSKAESLYADILSQPAFDNARLRYNLGNVYLAKHELGKAIHQYRHSLALEPDAAPVLANLQLARERRKDQLKQPETDRVLKTLFAFHYDLSYGTRSTIFLIAYIAFFATLCLRLLTRRHPALTSILVVTALLALATAISLGATWSQRRQPTGVITAKVVHAKTGSSNSYQDAFEAPLHDGTEFTLLKQDTAGQWLNIRLDNRQTCWIPASSAQL